MRVTSLALCQPNYMNATEITINGDRAYSCGLCGYFHDGKTEAERCCKALVSADIEHPKKEQALKSNGPFPEVLFGRRHDRTY